VILVSLIDAEINVYGSNTKLQWGWQNKS